MELYNSKINKLPQFIINQLLKLNLGDADMLKRDLEVLLMCKNCKYNSSFLHEIAICIEGKTVLGWTLSRLNTKTKYKREFGRMVTYIYVSKKHRGRGIGKQLFNYTTDLINKRWHRKTVTCYAWNLSSYKFFNNMKKKYKYLRIIDIR